VRVEVFLGTGPERSTSADAGHEAAARLLGRRPDVAFEVSPALGEALGDGVRQILRAAEELLRGMSPNAAALADALEQTSRSAHSTESGDAPFVLVVAGSSESLAERTPAVGDAARTTTVSPPALTHLEREILERVARGQTDGQIAEALYMSRRTVQNHLHRIREKTGLLTRAELILWASQLAATT
jgi:DNA-binding CsgD family transcriptional regulator